MAENETDRPRGPCKPGDQDEQAVARMLDGHTAAEELSKKYGGAFLKRALKLLHDSVRAEQVVQDTFVDAFNQLGTFKGQSSFFTWLYGIFKYRLLKERKAVVAAGRAVPFESESASRSSDPEDQEAAQPQEAGWIDQIEQALTLGRQHTPEKDHEARVQLLAVVKDIREFLTPQTKEVFYLIVAGLSFGEIARVLDVSDANVRNHVKRGREVLKEKRDERRRVD
jgi:RNA polymerase sigma-70 factor (ECF subfamily)